MFGRATITFGIGPHSSIMIINAFKQPFKRTGCELSCMAILKVDRWYTDGVGNCVKDSI